jgi:hypothetical protein
VLFISVLSNIPIFFEFTTGFDSETQQKRLEITALRIDENYIILYKNVFEGIVLMILPLIAMVCLNARIIFTLRKRGGTILSAIVPSNRYRQEMNLAKVLVTMDIVFLICNLGRVIVNIWETFHIEQLKECLRLGLPYEVENIENYIYCCQPCLKILYINIFYYVILSR